MIRCQGSCIFAGALVKRETGANPVRTRHRNQGAKADISLGNREDGLAMIFKPGDLPESCTKASAEALGHE